MQGKSKNKKKVSAKRLKQLKRECANCTTSKQFQNIAVDLVKTIHHFFPDLSKQLLSLNDPRKGYHYNIEEIVFAGIAMFIFKCGSRNAMDAFAKKSPKFKKNYFKAFGHRLPDMDTVALVFDSLLPEELERLKKQLVSRLLKKKVFDKWRFKGHVVIAVDGTGIVSFDHQHCEQCIKKVSKNGKTTWMHNVLEAKLVTNNGFSISLCTQWIENPTEGYNKQDCEKKAFERLARKLKDSFPHLSICICADGLYPNNTFFNICQNFRWKYIVTLKDGNLKTMWRKIRQMQPQSLIVPADNRKQTPLQEYQWLNAIEVNGHIHNWIELKETSTDKKNNPVIKRFVHLTNITITPRDATLISSTGRLRWLIENQGFDIQKNHGYNICHKYSRCSYPAMKNFYQCCQIAHMFNQLTELSKTTQSLLRDKTTLTFLWDYLLWTMAIGHINKAKIEYVKNHRTQIQFLT